MKIALITGASQGIGSAIAQELNQNSFIENKFQAIVGAKRVRAIDGYAETLKIEKFDLVIDWGFLYFLTKPMWYCC